MNHRASSIGAVSCFVIGIFTVVSVIANLLSGDFLYYKETYFLWSPIPGSLDWYNVGTLKELFASLGLIAVLLSIPAVVGIVSHLGIKLGKVGKLAAISIVAGSVFMALYYISAQNYPGAHPPITERTPAAAFPAIIRVLEGEIALMNIYLILGGALTYAAGFGLFALRLRQSDIPRAVWIIGVIQSLVMLVLLVLLLTGPIYMIYPLLDAALICNQLIFAVWMILLGTVLSRGIVRKSLFHVRGSGLALIISALILIAVIGTSFMTGLWAIVYETERMFLGQLTDFTLPLSLLFFMGVLAFMIGAIGSFGTIGFLGQQSRKRLVPATGMLLGSLMFLGAYGLTSILSHLGTIMEFSTFHDWSLRLQLPIEMNLTLIAMNFLFIVGSLLFFTLGVIPIGYLCSDAPPMFMELNIFFGFIGIAATILYALSWPIAIFHLIPQIVLGLMCVSFILIGVTMRRDVSTPETMITPADEGAIIE